MISDDSNLFFSRVSSKRFFLTYHINNETDLSLQDLLMMLFSKTRNYVIREYAIVKEGEEEKSKHIHAYIELQKALDIRNRDYFNLTVNNITLYANIRKVYNDPHAYQSPLKKVTEPLNQETPISILDYILKDIFDTSKAVSKKEFIVSKGIRRRIGPIGDALGGHQAALYLAEKGDIRNALDLIKKEDYEYYLKNFIPLKENLESIAKENNNLLQNAYSRAINSAKQGRIDESLSFIEQENAKDYLQHREQYLKNINDIANEKHLRSIYDTPIDVHYTEIFSNQNIECIQDFMSDIKQTRASGENPILCVRDNASAAFLQPLIKFLKDNGIETYILSEESSTSGIESFDQYIAIAQVIDTKSANSLKETISKLQQNIPSEIRSLSTGIILYTSDFMKKNNREEAALYCSHMLVFDLRYDKNSSEEDKKQIHIRTIKALKSHKRK